MTAPSPDLALDAIRREIDSIDGRIVDLLVQRFAATEKVRLTKARDGSIASSPFRPAREADMLRRLVSAAGPALTPDVLVRLWRVILSASIQSQAPVTLHMHSALGHDLPSRLLVAQHFCGMEVRLHATPAAAIDMLGSARGDLGLLDPASDWAGAMPALGTGGAQVIGTLPVLAPGPRPQLLVCGHAEPQSSGDDETLLLIPAAEPSLPAAAWQVRSGNLTLAGVGGFLKDGDPQLASLLRQLPGARVAGRYPRPIKVLP